MEPNEAPLPMPNKGVRMMQVNEEDLATLERFVPMLCERLAERTDNADRVMIRQIKAILSNVRWNYQPHSGHEIVGGELDA